MDKQEILHRLKSSREWNTVEDTENWRLAFDYYNKSQGTKLKTKDRCQKCYNAVLEWLQKP